MRKILMITLATVMMAASLQADAGGRHGHYGHGGYSHARVGVYIGAPLLFAPWYYPSAYYYPSPVVVRERVVVREPLVYYDERGNPVPSTAAPQVAQAPAQPQPQSPSPSAEPPTWYFCADTQTYYPYAQTCASPWQRVIPQPPPR